MGNEIVCYKNDMNLVPMRNFNSVEMDLFFSICSQMREQGLKTIEFSFDDLKNLSDYKPTAKQRFADDIESVYRKLLSLQFYQRDENHRGGFVLFTSYDINLTDEIVKIKVNSDFEYVLNQLSREFTKFELEEFTSLRSSYAKTAYRLLKQYRKTGYAIFTIENFRELLCIPAGYQVCDIDRNVLSIAKKELSEYFKGLKINKVKAKKGRRITHIEFMFQSEDDQLANGKYRIKAGKKFVEKDPGDLTEDEINKVFPEMIKTLSEKLGKEEDLEAEIEKLLLQRRKMREKKQEEEKQKIEGQVEIKL